MKEDKAAEFHLELNEPQLQLLLDMMKLGVKHTHNLSALREMNELVNIVVEYIHLQAELMSINPTNERDI